MARVADNPTAPLPATGWHLVLAAIFLTYFLLGLLYASRTPPWQAPDEPAHYNYVRQLASGSLPIIEPSDYDEQYRSEAVSSGFAPAYPIEPLSYEDWQPPLYYLLLTPVFLLFDGALLPLRIASLSLGLGIIGAAYAVSSTLWRSRPWLPLCAALFVALLPQHIAILASVNNDSLALLLIALMLWLLALVAGQWHSGKQVRDRRWLALGLLLGAGFITKLTVYIMAPVILIAALAIYWRRWRLLFETLVRVALPSVLFGGLWWARNVLVYRAFDPLATAAHDAAVVGQPRTAHWLATYGGLETAERFVTTTFRSFWGQFGWMGVLMDPRIYQLLLLFSLAILTGFLWRMATRRSGLREPGTAWRLLPWLLAVTFALNVALYFGYNITFVQHQGRYLFPALIPIAVAAAAGMEVWIAPLARRWPIVAAIAPALLAMSLTALNLLALFRYIVPQLAMP